MMTREELTQGKVIIAGAIYKTTFCLLLQTIQSELTLKRLTNQPVSYNQLEMVNHPFTQQRKFKESLIRLCLEDK